MMAMITCDVTQVIYAHNMPVDWEIYRDKHIMLLLQPIMLCSNSVVLFQICFHLGTLIMLKNKSKNTDNVTISH